MNQGDSQNEPPVPKPWQPRFSLAGMLMVMFVVALVSAACSYLAQAIRGGRGSQFTFIMFTLAAPALALVLVSAAWGIFNWLSGRGRR